MMMDATNQMTEIFGEPISVYTVEDGMRDGSLVPLLKHRWDRLTGGRPLVATPSLVNTMGGIRPVRGCGESKGKFTVAALMEVFNDYVAARSSGGVAGLGSDEEIYRTLIDEVPVWLSATSEAITLYFPSER